MISMKKRIENEEIPGETETTPRISLILPYELKMKNKPGLYHLLTDRAEEVEMELLRKYPRERVVPVMAKLRKVIKTVQCPVHEKTVGIFVSPVAEKIYYFSPSHLEGYRLSLSGRP